ncbi:MAG: hypothetical protein Gyms2KO_23470 [Gymnodinialimonas sp.]
MDNLWFSVLFKRAAWTQNPPTFEDVAKAADLFKRAMTSGLRGNLRPEEHALLMSLRAQLPPNGRWKIGASASAVDSLLDSSPRPQADTRAWGWKEPNTHIFLPHLATLFPQMRYIHVVRDGLDMAFSKNTWQARHWGRLYGLPYRWYRSAPQQQLRFWLAANRATLEFGKTHMPGRFLVVPYEDYCARPDWHWPRLHDFLELPPNTSLSHDILRPTSIGRSQDHDLTSFPQDLLSSAAALQSELKAFHAPPPNEGNPNGRH